MSRTMVDITKIEEIRRQFEKFVGQFLAIEAVIKANQIDIVSLHITGLEQRVIPEISKQLIRMAADIDQQLAGVS